MRRWGALAVAIGAAVTMPAFAAGALAAPPPRLVPASLDRFFRYDRPATYQTRREYIPVPTRDGTTLGCYLYEPAVSGHEAPGRFPGIIDNFTPYYLAYPVGAFTGTYFAEHGYLDLECTPRGTGTSGGVFTGWFSPTENLDNYDMIEWLAQRSDSTGRIAQEGDSYGGMTAYRVASLHPPGLVTIAPQQSYASMYLDFTYPGGIRSLGDPDWYEFAAEVGLGRSLTSTQELSWLEHPLLDAYWRQIDITPRWSSIHLPILGFGGWVDIFQNGMVDNYLGLRSPTTYLIDGPWTHGSTFDRNVTVGALLAWFDRWLKGDERAPLPPTHVSSYVMPAGPWVDLGDWPPTTAARPLALTSNGALAAAAGPAGTEAYAVNPLAGAVDLPAGDHLDFEGAPLPRAETIAGSPTLHLVATLGDPTHGLGAAAPSLVDTNFVVHLYDVAASGQQSLITRGYLKASHRRSQSTPEVLPLDRPLSYDIGLWNIDWRIPAGDHLRLEVETGEQDCCLSSAPAVTQPLLPLTVTVATGARGSQLTVPVQR